MKGLLIEGILCLIILFGVGFSIWKFALSKIPTVRVFFKLSDIEEADVLAKEASSVDMGKAKDHKQVVTDFTKEKF